MAKQFLWQFSLKSTAFIFAVGLAVSATLVWAEQIEAGPKTIANHKNIANPKDIDAPSPAQIKAGKMLFVKATCWGCHPHGENSMNGDKPLKGPRFTKKYQNDEELMQTIRRGSVKRGMPPFPVEKLSEQDLKQIVVFIRSLYCSAKP